uniref:serine-rich adhesin for platelets-like n=1 Tax=Myxine glutinosa TaxID=7769 RepID=UPI00358DF4D9
MKSQMITEQPAVGKDTHLSKSDTTSEVFEDVSSRRHAIKGTHTSANKMPSPVRSKKSSRSSYAHGHDSKDSESSRVAARAVRKMSKVSAKKDVSAGKLQGKKTDVNEVVLPTITVSQGIGETVNTSAKTTRHHVPESAKSIHKTTRINVTKMIQIPKTQKAPKVSSHPEGNQRRLSSTKSMISKQNSKLFNDELKDTFDKKMLASSRYNTRQKSLQKSKCASENVKVRLQSSTSRNIPGSDEGDKKTKILQGNDIEHKTQFPTSDQKNFSKEGANQVQQSDDSFGQTTSICHADKINDKNISDSPHQTVVEAAITETQMLVLDSVPNDPNSVDISQAAIARSEGENETTRTEIDKSETDDHHEGEDYEKGASGKEVNNDEVFDKESDEEPETDVDSDGEEDGSDGEVNDDGDRTQEDDDDDDDDQDDDDDEDHVFCQASLRPSTSVNGAREGLCLMEIASSEITLRCKPKTPSQEVLSPQIIHEEQLVQYLMCEAPHPKAPRGMRKTPVTPRRMSSSNPKNAFLIRESNAEMEGATKNKVKEGVDVSAYQTCNVSKQGLPKKKHPVNVTVNMLYQDITNNGNNSDTPANDEQAEDDNGWVDLSYENFEDFDESYTEQSIAGFNPIQQSKGSTTERELSSITGANSNSETLINGSINGTNRKSDSDKYSSVKEDNLVSTGENNNTLTASATKVPAHSESYRKPKINANVGCVVQQPPCLNNKNVSGSFQGQLEGTKVSQKRSQQVTDDGHSLENSFIPKEQTPKGSAYNTQGDTFSVCLKGQCQSILAWIPLCKVPF